MSDDKSSEELPQSEQTETTKEEQKDNGDSVKSDKVKIDILLKATGNAPIMKKKKWAVDAEKPIGWIMEFVKKYLKLEADEKLTLSVRHESLNYRTDFHEICYEVRTELRKGHRYFISRKKFLYVNQTFAPSPDQIIKNLYECFGTDGKLVLHYCKSQAWG